MTPIELAKQIRDRLQEVGSIDARVLNEIDTALKISSAKAKASILCEDKNILELYDTDARLSEISCGNEDIFGLPYGEHTILIFDARS